MVLAKIPVVELRKLSVVIGQFHYGINIIAT
jgi:hypothetical protein